MSPKKKFCWIFRWKVVRMRNSLGFSSEADILENFWDVLLCETSWRIFVHFRKKNVENLFFCYYLEITSWSKTTAFISFASSSEVFDRANSTSGVPLSKRHSIFCSAVCWSNRLECDHTSFNLHLVSFFFFFVLRVEYHPYWNILISWNFLRSSSTLTLVPLTLNRNWFFLYILSFCRFFNDSLQFIGTLLVPFSRRHCDGSKCLLGLNCQFSLRLYCRRFSDSIARISPYLWDHGQIRCSVARVWFVQASFASALS